MAGTSAGVLVEILAALHEPVTARAALADYPSVSPVGAFGGLYQMMLLRARIVAALAEQDWPAALAVERDFAPLAAQYPGLAAFKPSMIDPSVALALAHSGQFAAAEARLEPMPGDCYLCLRARAEVAALQGQDARADFWFARAAVIGPSLPYAESEWGSALLDRAKPDDAIAKFKLANRKGPHFADPLEGWGEALMAQSRSDLALAKFAEADKYAPNWGRLHLKWGEALAYANKPDEAKKQFAIAAGLDLVAADRTELSRVSGHG
jgi:tetratricopeptide (TPR) repeat protein